LKGLYLLRRHLRPTRLDRHLTGRDTTGWHAASLHPLPAPRPIRSGFAALAFCVTATGAALTLHDAAVFVGFVAARFEFVYIRRLDTLIAVAHANARAFIIGHQVIPPRAGPLSPRTRDAPSHHQAD
jgi:hypothetical protein